MGIIVLVHQQEVKILERFGKYFATLQPGLSFKLPLVDEVSYHHSLKEQVLDIDNQQAITKDNVKITLDGVLYFKIQDAYSASYQVSNPINALSLLAQTSMRSEIGKLELDRTFEERDSLNTNIKAALNEAGQKWGVDCLRYEIKDIKPPEQIKRSMELQAESERLKRSAILHSEGEMRSKINSAEASKKEQILDGEGQAATILQEAKSLSEALNSISMALQQSNLEHQESGALNLRLTEQYMEALELIMKKSSTLMIPTGGQPGDLTSPQTIAQIMATYKHMSGGSHQSEELMKGSMPSPDTLKSIVEELEELKRKGVSGGSTIGKKDDYRYLDDKTLYSTD